MRLAVKFATASHRKSGRARKTVTTGEARTRGIYGERPPGVAG